MIERGRGGSTRWPHQRIKASEDGIHLSGDDAAQAQGTDIVLRQHCSTHIRAVVVLWGGQLRRLATLNKFLEGWTGAVLAKICVLVFIIIFIQKRPQGIFAVKGRTADA